MTPFFISPWIRRFLNRRRPAGTAVDRVNCTEWLVSVKIYHHRRINYIPPLLNRFFRVSIQQQRQTPSLAPRQHPKWKQYETEYPTCKLQR